MHDHVHHRSGNGALRPLLIAFLLTLGFSFVEVVGGWLSGSLALLSDAGHMLTDAFALALGAIAAALAKNRRIAICLLAGVGRKCWRR